MRTWFIMMEKQYFAILFMLGFTLIANAGNDDYCDDPNHVMCKYPKNGIRGSCRMRLNSFSRKVYMTHYFNDLRQKLACRILLPGSRNPSMVQEHQWKNPKYPPASNMRVFYWNDELQKFAERMASQCKGHDQSVTCDTAEFTGIMIQDGTAKPGIEEMDTFRNRFRSTTIYANGDWAYSKTKSNEGVGFYWDTSHVACAWTDERSRSATDVQAGVQRRNWYCVFGKAYPNTDEPLYKIGLPASECPEGTSNHSQYKGLCANNDDKSGARPEVQLLCGSWRLTQVCAALLLAAREGY